MPSGYEKSPDYSGRPLGPWDWVLAAVFMVVLTALVGWAFFGWFR